MPGFRLIWASFTKALNRADEAQAAYRLVLALEEARLSKDGGALLPRPIQDYSLYLHVVGRLAALLGMHSSEAVDLVNTANNLHDQWQPGWRSVEMVAGRLPDATGAPKNGATVVAELTIFLGRAAQNAGRLELAKKHFQTSSGLRPRPPYTAYTFLERQYEFFRLCARARGGRHARS